MRSLMLSASLLGLALLAASAVANPGAVSELRSLQTDEGGQLAPVKAVPEDSSALVLQPHVVTRQGLSTTTPEVQTRIKVAERCGTTNLYCNPPTPVCCGTPGKYYCARDANGCNQR